MVKEKEDGKVNSRKGAFTLLPAVVKELCAVLGNEVPQAIITQGYLHETTDRKKYSRLCAEA